MIPFFVSSGSGFRSAPPTEREEGGFALKDHDSSISGGGGGDETFACSSCGRRFRWKQEIAGRSLRCKCGSKVRCPETRDETLTAHESLEDTVADVELDEALDTIETTEAAPIGADDDVKELFEARWKYRGVFGLSLGGEVALYFGLSLIGIACAILAVILGRYFWWWIAAAVLLGPLSWWRFWQRWRRWTAGRSFLDALNDAFDMRDSDNAAG